MTKDLCNKCGVLLTDENWYPSRRKVNRHICAKCYKIINKEYLKEWHKKTHTLHKKLLYKLKEKSSCALCGYDKYLNALDFHHVNPNDKKFHICSNATSRKDFADELQKCICLCANCHRYITKMERQL